MTGRRLGAWLATLILLGLTSGCGKEGDGAAPASPRPVSPHPATGSAAPGELQHYVNLGRAHYESRRANEAIHALGMAVLIQPRSAELRVALALAYLLAQDELAAVSTLEEALQLAPDSIAAAYLTGLAHLRAGRFDLAAPHLRRAVAGDPGVAALHFQLAQALKGLGDTEGATRELSEVVRIDPHHASAFYQLSVLTRSGLDRERSRLAQAEFERLRAVIPDSARTPEFLERCRYTRIASPGSVQSAPAAIPVRFERAEGDTVALQALLGRERETWGEAITGADAAWIDHDVDGDLDLLVVDDDGITLHLCNAAGTRHPLPGCGLDDAPGQAQAVAVGDLDEDDDLDACVATANGLVVLRNVGLGQFAVELPAAGAAPVTACLLEDTDGDTLLDTIAATAGTVKIATSSGRRVSLEGAPETTNELIALDFDNDGFTDLLALGSAPGARLWRNLGAEGWTDATATVGLDTLQAVVRTALATDLDGDGDTDLVLDTDDGAMLLTNAGGSAHGLLVVNLVGTRSNPAGIGARVEVRAGAFRASRSVTRVPVVLGVAGHERFDSVRVQWPNGVVQHELGVSLDPTQPLEIEEKTVVIGSCPYLYVWRDDAWHFVTDILGTSPVALSATRDFFIPADPEELVKIGPADSQSIMITNELREVTYLDRVRVLAVDRRPNEEVHATDKVMMPPFPPSEVWWVGDLRAPATVIDEGGNEVSGALAAIDEVRVGPTRLRPGQERGLAEPTSLTMTFDAGEGLRTPVLVLTGWLQWGDASVNIGVSQGPVRRGLLPTLEILEPDGAWRQLPLAAGAPAGKTKTILCDLSGALAGRRGEQTLRLASDLEIYWDRIALAERRPEGNSQWLEVERASLTFLGWAKPEKAERSAPLVPDPQTRLAHPPWSRTLRGACTRYGVVTDLLHASDNRMVIMSSGDAVIVRAARPAPPPRGHLQELFLYSVGWDKDADYNVGHNQTVTPLPFRGMDDNRYDEDLFPWTEDLLEWAKTYNTRWVTGRY